MFLIPEVQLTVLPGVLDSISGCADGVHHRGRPNTVDLGPEIVHFDVSAASKTVSF